MENVATQAIGAHNAKIIELTQASALNLIAEIQCENAKIEGCESRIVSLRVELAKVANNVCTEETVYGGSLPENANKATITSVIAKANRDKQFNVERASGALVVSINYEQNAIIAISKRVVELRKKLTELTAPVVTVAQIMG